MKEAAKFYNVVGGTITYRVNSDNQNFKEWYFIKEEV